LPLLIIPFTPIWKTKLPSNIISRDGNINADNIRGSNTLEYLIETTNIPFEVFQEKLNLPDNVDMHLKLKSFGPEYNLKNHKGEILETEDFREVVRNYDKNQNDQNFGDCPFGKVDCKFPGECMGYQDINQNNICDRSELK